MKQTTEQSSTSSLAGCLHRGEEKVFMVGQSLGMDTFIQQQLPGGVYPCWEPECPGHKHTGIAILVLASLPPCYVVLPCPNRVLRVEDEYYSTMDSTNTIVYPYSGNFQGRKLLGILRFCA